MFLPHGAVLTLNSPLFCMYKFPLQHTELRCIFGKFEFIICIHGMDDRLCGLVVTVLGYRSGGLGSIPGTTRKKIVGLERGPLSLASTTEELLDRKVAAPV
jgi:hypothetical protein